MPADKVKVTSLDTATSVSSSDRLLIAQSGTSRQVAPSLLSGAGGRLVFEWNGEDTSQFEATPAFREADTGATGSLSVVSGDYGNVLRYTGVETSGLGEVFLASDALPFTGTYRNMRIEIEVHSDTSPTSASFGGVCYYADDSGANFSGFIHGASTGNGHQRWIIEDGTVVYNSGPSGSAFRIKSIYTLTGQKPDGAPPFFTITNSGYSRTSGVAEQIRRIGSTSTIRGGVTEFGSTTTLDSTWDDLQCDRWGLTVGKQSGGAVPTVDFLSIRVYIQE